MANKEEKDKITIVNDEGVEKEMMILFTYNDEDTGKDYIFIYPEDEPLQVYAFKYNDKGELSQVNDEEYKLCNEILDSWNKDQETSKDV